MISGAMPACSQANRVPVRPKPVAISSAISRTSKSIAQGPHPPQVFRGINAHAAGALHDRFENDRGQFRPVPFDQLRERGDVGVIPFAIVAAIRRRCKKMLRQNAGEQMMHPGVRITDRHGSGGIAVVAVADGQQPRSFRIPAGVPVLNGHLDRHFDADRSGIAQEHALQRLGGDRAPGGQPVRRRGGGSARRT